MIGANDVIREIGRIHGAIEEVEYAPRFAYACGPGPCSCLGGLRLSQGCQATCKVASRPVYPAAGRARSLRGLSTLRGMLISISVHALVDVMIEDECTLWLRQPPKPPPR